MSTTRTIEAGTITGRHRLPPALIVFAVAAVAMLLIAVALLSRPASVGDTVADAVVAPSGSSGGHVLRGGVQP